jgi:hypothetical protein
MVMFRRLLIGLIQAFINIFVTVFYLQIGQMICLTVVSEKSVFDFVGVRFSPQPIGLN